jgi:hypothetical protein
MTLADLFDWFALDSKHVAEQTDDPKQRERWMKLAELWAAAARQSCDEAKPGYVPPGGPTNFARLKASQDNRVPAGFKYVPPTPVRRKG